MAITTNSYVLGLSGTDTNNFLLDTDGAGSLRIRRKSDGSGGTVLTVNSAGTLVQPAQSMVRLNTANGYGSTNTMIRRFTNTVTNQGSDITYADSATLGGSFTINTSGVYAISYCDDFSSVGAVGISLNTTTPSTSFFSIAAAEKLAGVSNPFGNYPTEASWCGYLAAGSVVRAHGTAAGTGGNIALFTISRVA